MIASQDLALNLQFTGHAESQLWASSWPDDALFVLLVGPLPANATLPLQVGIIPGLAAESASENRANIVAHGQTVSVIGLSKVTTTLARSQDLK